jgi:hypothetical protein
MLYILVKGRWPHADAIIDLVQLPKPTEDSQWLQNDICKKQPDWTKKIIFADSFVMASWANYRLVSLAE